MIFVFILFEIIRAGYTKEEYFIENLPSRYDSKYEEKKNMKGCISSLLAEKPSDGRRSMRAGGGPRSLYPSPSTPAVDQCMDGFHFRGVKACTAAPASEFHQRG